MGKPECCGAACQGKTCNWSEEEDSILLSHHKILGNKWTEISRALGGRTDNAVKNRFATLSKKAKSGTKRKRNAAEQETPPDDTEGTSLSKKKVGVLYQKRRGGRPVVEPLQDQKALGRRSGMFPATYRPNSHAHYARMQAALQPCLVRRCGMSPVVPHALGDRNELLISYSSHLNGSNPDHGLFQQSKPSARESTSAWIIQPPNAEVLGWHKRDLVQRPDDQGLASKENTPPSEASTEHKFECNTWQDETKNNLPYGNGHVLASSDGFEIASTGQTCSGMVGTLELEPRISNDCSEDSQWNDDPLDGWLAENFTPEDMDELLPPLNALLPNMGA